MGPTYRNNGADRRVSTNIPTLALAVVVVSLTALTPPTQAFHQSNMFSSTALRRASAAALRLAGTAQPRHLATVRPGSALSMAWTEDNKAPRRRTDVDRGFSSGGVVDNSSGRDDSYPSSPRDREGGSGGRVGGGWANTDGRGGSGGGRQQRYSSERGGGGSWDGRGGGSRGGGGDGGDRYEQRGRGRGRGSDQGVDYRGGGGRSGGRSGYDRDFGGGREGGGRRSSSWDDNGARGRGRGGEGRGRGRSSYGGGGGRETAGRRGGRSYGGRESSFSGRRDDFGGRGRAGRGSSVDDGPSRAWTPGAGGDGDEMAWGVSGGGGAQRYSDDETESYGGGEEEEGSEESEGGWGPSRSSPASDWMRGELSDYQAELSPNDNVDEDKNFDMVYGIAPILNVLRNDRREKLGLYCQDGLAPANKKDRAAANQIYDLARNTDVPMTTTDKGYLNTLCGNRPHQGFILKARPLQFEPILFLPRIEDVETPPASSAETTTDTAATTESTAESGADDAQDEQTSAASATAAPKKPPAPLAAAATGQVWLALDEVTDPQNFGALLRSAHFFGASGVVTCAKNSASLTATVSKSSAGAVEVMRVHSTANMMRFLKRSRENGWRVVGTSVSERSGPLHELPAGPGAPPTIVVLGNEGYGVRTNVLRECEFLVEVAGDGGGAVAEGATASTVDSLNVSVTGGVVLFHLLAGAKHAAAYAAAAAATATATASSD